MTSVVKHLILTIDGFQAELSIDDIEYLVSMPVHLKPQ